MSSFGRPQKRKPQPEPRQPAFSLFLCSECYVLGEDKYQDRQCLECGSGRYIKRYVCEKGVTTIHEAIAFYIAEMTKERDKLTKILANLKVKE